MLARIFLALIAIVAFSSCEDSMILKSEKKMKEDLQGTWQRSYQGEIVFVRYCPTTNDSASYIEYWTFEGDNLHTTFRYDPFVACDRGTPDFNKNDNVDTAVISKFKVDARLLDAFLKFQIVSTGNDSSISFIDKWEFITLDDDVLYLATDDPKGNAVLQLEFAKLK